MHRLSGRVAWRLFAAGFASLALSAGAERGDLEDPGWMEVTPLVGQARGQVFEVVTGGAVMVPAGFGPAPAMACTGGGGWGVRCLRLLEAGGAVLPEPRSGVRVAGRVLVGREPAAGARIALAPAELPARRPFLLPLFRDRQGFLRRWIRSGRDGGFELPQVAPGGYQLEVRLPGGRVELTEVFTVPAPEVLRAHLQEKYPETPLVFDRGDIVLVPGLAVEFRVWGPDGSPIAGAVVGGLQNQPTKTLLFEGKTAASGEVVLEGFVGGEIHASCIARGYRRYARTFPEPPPRVDCWMEPLANLGGSVVSAGDPVIGATVALSGHSRRVETDERGAFRLEGLAAGGYRLSVAAAGFRSEVVKVELSAGEDRELPPLSLVPVPEITGRVVDSESGEPVPNAAVIALQPLGAVATRSDEDGRFRFAAESDEGLILQVSVAGYPQQLAEVPWEPAREDEVLVIPLQKGGRLRVLVWDGDTDRPCAGCPLALTRPGESWQPVAGLETSVEGSAQSEELLPGLYHVTLEKVRSLGSVVQVESGDETQVVEVRRGEIAEVYFGPWGSTVRVRFWPPPPPGWRLRLDGTTTQTTVDLAADGSAEVRQRPGERLDLRLVGPGLSVYQGTLAASPRERTVELPLPSTLVTGRLTGGAEGAPEVRLRSLGGPSAGAWAVAPDGLFKVPFLPPGSYTLETGGRLLATVALAEGDRLDLGDLPLAEGTEPPR